LSRRLLSTGLVTLFPDRPELQRALDWLPRIDAEGFELSIFRNWDLDDAERRLSAASLPFAAAHCDKQIGAALVTQPGQALAAFAANCRLAEAVGARLAVLHLSS
jgi:hypothetical protein